MSHSLCLAVSETGGGGGGGGAPYFSWREQILIRYSIYMYTVMPIAPFKIVSSQLHPVAAVM